jgi:hypothetical protein
MASPRVDNRTDFVVHPQVVLDRDGEKLVCIVKATLECASTLGGALEIAPGPRRRNVRLADVPWGEPEKSSIAYPADLCVRKPATDVVVVARAHAPGGRPVPTIDVYVGVGPLRKALQVHGIRVWERDGTGISAPRPIAQLEMRYDFAWGGFDDSDPERPIEEARNPVGMGVARDPARLTDTQAPHIDDPAAPLKNWKTRPPPAGVGPVGRHWEPRRRYIGTYDQRWEEMRSPLPPEDQDDRHNLCASPGLVADPPLAGGEEVRLLNLVPDGGPTTFTLPRIALEIEFRAKEREPEVFRPHLDTVLVDLLGLRPRQPVAVEMVWRAAVRAPRQVQEARVLVREVTWTPGGARVS